MAALGLTSHMRAEKQGTACSLKSFGNLDWWRGTLEIMILFSSLMKEVHSVCIFMLVSSLSSLFGSDAFSLELQLMSRAENETLSDEYMHLVYSQCMYACTYINASASTPYLNSTWQSRVSLPTWLPTSQVWWSHLRLMGLFGKSGRHSQNQGQSLDTRSEGVWREIQYYNWLGFPP